MKEIINKINRWSNKDAEWYEFWMPQSAFMGGIIFGTLLMLPLLLF